MDQNTGKNNATNGKAIPMDIPFIETKNSIKKEEPALTRRQRLRVFLKSFIVEPFMYSFVFSMHMRSVCQQNLILDKACLVDLGYPEEICNNIHQPGNIEAKIQVQKLGNDLHMYSMVLHIVPSALCAIVLGPWSDKYSRKYPIIFSTVGVLLEILIIIIYVADFRTPATYLLVASVPAGMGGIMVVLTCIYSYLSELTTPENRTFRYALLDLGFLFAGPVGTTLGGILFQYYGYTVVFVSSFVAQLAGLIFLIIFMKDPKHENLKNYRAAFLDLFSLENIKDSIKTCTRKREGHVRLEIWLLFLSMCSIIICFMGTLAVGYLFTQRMYNWSVTKYSVVQTITVVSHGIAMLVIIPIFTKANKIHDAMLALVGVLGMAAQNVLKGFSDEEWMYYLAAALGILSGIGGIGLRARLSKLVAKEELGKVFSVLALTESITPVIGIVVFAQIYNATISFFPGLVFEVASCFLLIPIIVFIWIYKTSPINTNTDPTKDASKKNTDEMKMEHVF